MRTAHIAILTILCTASHALAHEFWIQPASYLADAGEVLRIRLMHGERFAGSPVPRNNAMIERFRFLRTEQEIGNGLPVIGRDRTITSFVRADDAGVLVYESDWYPNELTGEKFEAYLEEERLPHIAQERARLGESQTPGIERYKRCAKAVLAGTEGTIQDRWIGLPLEIMVARSSDSDTMTAAVRLHNEPAPGIRLVAVSKDAPAERVELLTDELGHATLTIDQPGPWMLTALHMVRTDPGVHADWESYWASTTFAR